VSQLEEIVRFIIRDEVRQAVREEVRAALAEARSVVQPDTEFLTVKDAASLAQVSAATVRAWIQRGHLPCHRTGRLWRIRKDQFLNFLERGPSPADAAVSLEERATRILARRAR
jgi:excisionase family DNA binding protein